MAYRQTEAVSVRLANNRRRILNAARELIAEAGFAGTPMSAVAARSGLATGTLYRYFASRQELFGQVFREVSTREMKLLAALAAREAPAAARLADMIRTFATRAVQGRRLAYALLAEPVDAGLAQERQIFRRTHAELFARVLADGMARGEITPLNAQIAAACIAGAIPTALIGPLAPDAHELDAGGCDVIEAIVGFCLQAVGLSGTMAAADMAARDRMSA